MKFRCCAFFILTLAAAQADPPAKPRLVPRPIPGMTRTPVSPPPATANVVAPRPSTGTAPTPDASTANQARIITIYRRGTFSLPGETAATSPASAPAAEVAKTATKPAPPAAPAPGKVRILTKAELDLLSAQPSP